MKAILQRTKPINICLLLSASTLSLAAPPEVNDPLFQQVGTDLEHQWGLHAMNLHRAWEFSTGHAYVAVLDSGIQVLHPDLQENFRPLFSWDFHNMRYDVDELTPYTNGGGIMDWVGHGTHVAGIIAASANNGLGGAGICWHCSLMVGKLSRISVTNDGENAARIDHDKVAYAINTAVDTGAQVINMSFGTYNTDELDDALAHAREMDVVVVAANGNITGSHTAIEYPASAQNVLAIGALDIDGNVPEWSKSGPEQDLAAPGVHVLSAFYANHDYIPLTHSMNDTYKCAESFLTPREPGYGPCSGTSMAAPYISGSVALIRSVNPLLSSDQVKDILIRYATYPDDTEEGYGHGLPDMLASVQAALGTVNGQTLVNRLTPLFSLYSSAAGDHFYTSSPQMAMAAMYERLQPQPMTGPDVKWTTGEGEDIIGYVNYPRTAFMLGYQPEASAFIFTTHRNPINPDGGDLSPLYRLSYRGTDGVENQSNIDHTYATNLDEVEYYKQQGYHLDGIEGYIFPSHEAQPSGTVRLLRKYNPQRDDHAIFPEYLLPRMMANGYTQNSGEELLGYVYQNQDSDRDGLIDGFEEIIGTDVNAPDSDYDGQTDGAEIGTYPYTDPLDGLAVNSFTLQVEMNSNTTSLQFTENLDNTPVVLSQMQTSNGGNTAATRIRQLNNERIELFLEEERSYDNEISHLDETVGILGLPEGDIVNIDGQIIGEAGFISSIVNGWTLLNFSRSYSNPIVLMDIVTYNGGEPAHIRLDSVSSSNARFKVEEWDYLDGVHDIETVSYIVIEQGAQVLQSGKAIRTGIVEANHRWSDVTFNDMSATPILFSQSQTYNGYQSIVTRQRDVQADGFSVRLQEEEGNDGYHAIESVGYLAIE